jgi:hypothetical protein
MIVSLAPGQYTAIVEDAAGQGSVCGRDVTLMASTTTRVQTSARGATLAPATTS